jgi:hypothetical protein
VHVLCIEVEMRIFLKHLFPITVTVVFFCFLSKLNAVLSEETDTHYSDTTTEISSTQNNTVLPHEHGIKGYLCCFCDASIDDTTLDPVFITLAFNNSSSEVLYYFAHIYCLHASICKSMRCSLENMYARHAINE